jgi:hypothetical protein
VCTAKCHCQLIRYRDSQSEHGTLVTFPQSLHAPSSRLEPLPTTSFPIHHSVTMTPDPAQRETIDNTEHSWYIIQRLMCKAQTNPKYSQLCHLCPVYDTWLFSSRGLAGWHRVLMRLRRRRFGAPCCLHLQTLKLEAASCSFTSHKSMTWIRCFLVLIRADIRT